MEESDSLFESDLLICDWSAMAIEYALGLGKPVLFVDVPPRVRNPNYAELGLEPMEMRIRRELGARPAARPGGGGAHARGRAARATRRSSASATRRCGRGGCSTSAGASRWARGRSPASPTSGPAPARAADAREGDERRAIAAPSVRRRLLRWAHWFAAANVALLMIVGLGYLWHYSPVGVVGWTYAAIAYLGHLAALAYVPLVLVLVPAAVLVPRPRVVLPLGVVLAAAGVSSCSSTAWSSPRTGTT